MREHEKPSRSVGRPREFDEDEVIEKIMSLFWEQGYEGTGLSDIMGATGLKKGSLYKAFGSKHEMYVRSLAHYERLVVDSAVTGLKSDTPPLDRISAFLSSPIDARWTMNDRRGCFLCNASADHAALDDDTRERVEHGFNKLARALEAPVKQARPGWNPEQIENAASLLLSVYSGLRVMTRASLPRRPLEGARDMAMSVIAG